MAVLQEAADGTLTRTRTKTMSKQQREELAALDAIRRAEESGGNAAWIAACNRASDVFRKGKMEWLEQRENTNP